MRPYAVDTENAQVKVYDSKNSLSRVVPLNAHALAIVQKYRRRAWRDLPLFMKRTTSRTKLPYFPQGRT